MKKILLGLGVLMPVLFACSNISSSQLKSTDAKDLRIFTEVDEHNGVAKSKMYTLLQTLPDRVGIKFNQGETLAASSEASDGTYSADIYMGYDSNIFNLGESYVAEVDTAPVGQNYRVIYSDAQGTQTTALFSSAGVPDLVTPTENQSVGLKQKVVLTWKPKNMADLYVKVDFSGGTTEAFSVQDTGSYTLDLSDPSFKDAGVGPATISLEHYTTYKNMAGYAEAQITVQSFSDRTVQLVN